MFIFFSVLGPFSSHCFWEVAIEETKGRVSALFFQFFFFFFAHKRHKRKKEATEKAPHNSRKQKGHDEELAPFPFRPCQPGLRLLPHPCPGALNTRSVFLFFFHHTPKKNRNQQKKKKKSVGLEGHLQQSWWRQVDQQQQLELG